MQVTSLLRFVGPIIARPFATWRAVAGERISLASLAFGYALPLALIGPVATYVARRYVGLRVGHVVYRSSSEAALAQSEFSFVLAIAGLLIVALLVELLAPAFGAARSFSKSFVITAFAYTPVWLATVTVLFPPLGFLQLAALGYEVFLLHAGLTTVLGVPRARAGGLAACAVVGTILIAVAFGELSAAVAGSG